MLQGIYWTLGLVFGSLALGFIIGLPITMGQVYGGKGLSKVLHVYIWYFRGVPFLVNLFLFYYGIFPSLGFKLTPVACSILVLGMRTGAYQSQIFRSGLISLGEGQMIAARSIGMSKLKAIFHITIPQALRICIPGWINEYAIILKDSAQTFALGVVEVLTRTRFIVAVTLQPLIPYLVCGVIFIFLTYGGTKIADIVYGRVRIPGLVGGV